jgi:hypothetical protein
MAEDLEEIRLSGGFRGSSPEAIDGVIQEE